MLGTRNQQIAKSKNKNEENVFFLYLIKFQYSIFENKENINIDNILPNKSTSNRNKANQINLKNNIESIFFDKKIENLISKNAVKNQNINKKSKSKNSLNNVPSFTTKNASVINFF